VPLYTPWDVARYTRVPIWSALAMLGRRHPDSEWLIHSFGRCFPPFALVDDLSDCPPAAGRISFRRLPDLYVRAFAVRSLAELTRTELLPRDRCEAIREAAWRVLDNHRHEPMFFGQSSPALGNREPPCIVCRGTARRTAGLARKTPAAGPPGETHSLFARVGEGRDGEAGAWPAAWPFRLKKDIKNQVAARGSCRQVSAQSPTVVVLCYLIDD
jgi:hypothetical protein